MDILNQRHKYLYIEYVLAEAARENAYDEMLERRGAWIELYGLDMDKSSDEVLLDEIDNNDVDFWEFHMNVNQRYANAAECFGRELGLDEQELLRMFNNRYGTRKNLVQIDWKRHENDGLYEVPQ